LSIACAPPLSPLLPPLRPPPLPQEPLAQEKGKSPYNEWLLKPLYFLVHAIIQTDDVPSATSPQTIILRICLHSNWFRIALEIISPRL
jgi:hypothetical protein